MRIAILDGYVDEPSCFGVPPYISPYVRYAAGAIKDAGHEFQYITVDEWRRGKGIQGNILLVITGALVPGRYLRGMPISFNELREISNTFRGTKILGGSAARYGVGQGGGKEPVSAEGLVDYTAKEDADAFIFDFLNGEVTDRRRSGQEWKKWSVLGAEMVTSHPDFPDPLIAEIETYRGCTRHYTGGCSFCMEPLFGKPVIRSVQEITDEVEHLHALGVKNFRLGCQSCFYSYGARDVGKKEVPEPNVDMIKRLLEGIREKAAGLKVLHIDNVNPAVVAEYPEKSRKITELIVRYCTPGNTASFGMETADEKVVKLNNINVTPEQTMDAIKIINEIGNARGDNGLPHFLPGLNILYGLPGESKDTYRKNYDFLARIVKENVLIRRINIRQVIPLRVKKVKINRKLLKEFKKNVDKNINEVMLRKVVPYGTLLKDVFLEMNKGNNTFGRQIGSYPLLVRLPYKKSVGKYVDVKIKGYGYRSITGLEYPIDANSASMAILENIPGIGRKRAIRIAANRPFKNIDEFNKTMDNGFNPKDVLNWISIE